MKKKHLVISRVVSAFSIEERKTGQYINCRDVRIINLFDLEIVKFYEDGTRDSMSGRNTR